MDEEVNLKGVVNGESVPLITAPKDRNVHFANLLLMSFGFLNVFFAFNGTQNLMSSLIPGKLGYWSVATIYASFSFGSLLIAPSFVQYAKPKWSMVAGAITYAAFETANLKPSWYTLIPAAIVLGMGASVIWAAQGTYLTAAAANYALGGNQPVRSAMGIFFGIFFAIFQCSVVLGNIVGALILRSPSQSTHELLFYVYIAVSAFGVILLMFLRTEQQQPSETSDTPVKPPSSLGSRVLNVLYVMKDKKMLLLAPVIAYSGIEMGFISGDFTRQCIGEVIGNEWIGFVMATFGGVDAISSFIMGKIADRTHGKRLIVTIGLISHALFFAVFIYLSYWRDLTVFIKENHWFLFLAVAVYGVGDSVWNTFPNVMMSTMFTNESEAAFSNLKLFQSLGFVCAFVWGPILPFRTKLLIVASSMCVAVASIFFLDQNVASIDKSDIKDEEGSEKDL